MMQWCLDVKIMLMPTNVWHTGMRKMHEHYEHISMLILKFIKHCIEEY